MGRKKGFWIKKDGYIATDNTMDNTTASIIKTQKKRRDSIPPLKVNGKGQKWIKTVYIPNLRKKLHSYRSLCTTYRRHARELDARAKVWVDKAKKEMRILKNKQVRTIRNYYSRKYTQAKKAIVKPPDLSPYVGNNTNVRYFGVFGQMISVNFCKKFDFTPSFLSHMMVIGFYHVFDMKYLEAWYLPKFHHKKALMIRSIEKRGYIVQYGKKKGVYILTLKGLDFLKQYDDFYTLQADAIKKTLRGNARKKPRINPKTKRKYKSNNSVASEQPK